MAFVITLRDLYPPAREDATVTPWTKMRTQESADGATGWSQIDLWTFPDPDADPSDPKVRNRTIETATLEHGYYRVQFEDATGDTSDFSEPMSNAVLPTWTPTVRQVAGLMRARTKERGTMTQIGTFTPKTAITAWEAEEAIRNEVGFMAMIVGFNPANANVKTAAHNLTKLRAAMSLESGFFPEQIEKGMSPYKSWQAQYKIDLEALYKILYPDDPDAVPAGTDPPMPSYSFPEDAGGMIGWGTRW